MPRRYDPEIPPNVFGIPIEVEMEEMYRHEELDLDIANLNPFFRQMLPEGPSTSQSTPTIQDNRFLTVPRSAPEYVSSPIERERNQYIRHVFRSEAPRQQRIPQSQPMRLAIPQFNRGKKSAFDTLYPMDPPSPTESEENTPTNSRSNTPSPPRSPIQLPEEYNTIPPPNSPVGGIPKKWESRAEDNINMGFGWAQSWIDTIKPSRYESEERISLPKIYERVPRRTLICLVAHMNVDDTIFHSVEIPMKTEKRVRKAIAKFFKLPIPFHRLRLSVDKYAEVPINQRIINRFGPVEYFRLDTKISNRWILHQIVNCPQERKCTPMCPPNFEVAKKGRTFF